MRYERAVARGFISSAMPVGASRCSAIIPIVPGPLKKTFIEQCRITQLALATQIVIAGCGYSFDNLGRAYQGLRATLPGFLASGLRRLNRAYNAVRHQPLRTTYPPVAMRFVRQIRDALQKPVPCCLSGGGCNLQRPPIHILPCGSHSGDITTVIGNEATTLIGSEVAKLRMPLERQGALQPYLALMLYLASWVVTWAPSAPHSDAERSTVDSRTLGERMDEKTPDGLPGLEAEDMLNKFVVLQGALKKGGQLNGQVGVVHGFHCDKDRYKVFIISAGFFSGRKIWVSSDNLTEIANPLMDPQANSFDLNRELDPFVRQDDAEWHFE